MRTSGIYQDINIDCYHKEEGISSSGINLILDCPKRYWHVYKNKETDSTNEAFVLGKAFHTLVLEPEKFESSFYAMTEEVDLRTKIGKELMASIEIKAKGKTILRKKDLGHILEMANEAKSHPVWNDIKDKQIENSIYWNVDNIYGTRLRSRPDLFNDGYIIDIKTTDSIKGFQRSIYQYGYHRQAAMQIDGLKHFNKEGDNHERFFAFFVIEKKAPYLTACFTLDPTSIEQGRKEYLEGAELYSECLKFNEWPGYDDKFQLTSIPKWAINKEEIF